MRLLRDRLQIITTVQTIAIAIHVIDTHMRMMCIFDVQQVATLFDVVATTEQHVHFFQGDFLRLRDEEPDEEGEENVDASEEVECVAGRVLVGLRLWEWGWRGDLQAAVVEEGWEELLQDGVCDVLHLRTHAHGLRTYVHGEDLGRPNPDGGSPRWLIEEDEEEK